MVSRPQHGPSWAACLDNRRRFDRESVLRSPRYLHRGLYPGARARPAAGCADGGAQDCGRGRSRMLDIRPRMRAPRRRARPSRGVPGAGRKPAARHRRAGVNDLGSLSVNREDVVHPCRHPQQHAPQNADIVKMMAVNGRLAEDAHREPVSLQPGGVDLDGHRDSARVALLIEAQEIGPRLELPLADDRHDVFDFPFENHAGNPVQGDLRFFPAPVAAG